ncbi:MAG TPA: hypothetical protein VKU19_27990 [Bryobacteraceae bacterium]|nr:hypothetical protein [Bryobacteraceae bacterium]
MIVRVVYHQHIIASHPCNRIRRAFKLTAAALYRRAVEQAEKQVQQQDS